MTHHPYDDPRSIFSPERMKHSLIKDKLRDYWRNPPSQDGNNPMDYYNSDDWMRSAYLVNYIKTILGLTKEAKILEIGSGVGRNLAVLKFSGYGQLMGLELSDTSIITMRDMMPVLRNISVYRGPAEQSIKYHKTNSFDLVFTVAVLEHIPDSTRFFNQIVRVTSKYLLTLEDEKTVSDRHFPRNYEKIFSRLGMKQIHTEKNIPGCCRGFRLRLFEKEIE